MNIGWPLRRRGALFIRLLLAGSLSYASATAATFNIADGDVAGLKTAIAAANTNHQNDTINLALNGSYVLTTVDHGDEDALPAIQNDFVGFSSYTTTVDGHGATITCQTSDSVAYLRVFSVSGKLVLQNLTIVGGHAHDYGGAIYHTSSSLSISNCQFKQNLAKYDTDFTTIPKGGAIYSSGTNLTVATSTFSSNQAFIANSSYGDGAAIFTASATTITQSYFEGGFAGGAGGAIDSTNTLSVTRSCFANNIDESGGAAITNSATATIENCTFVRNSFSSSSLLTISEGAASHLMIHSCTFHQDGASGGVIRAQSGSSSATVEIGNSLIDSPYSPFSSTGDNCIFYSDGYNMCNSDVLFFSFAQHDQVVSDPRLDPAGLQDNGGSTPTVALMSDSPAIDAGYSFGATTDQRGRTRPLDLPNYTNTGDGSDIGAYEADGDFVQSGPSLTVNTLIDPGDGVCTIGSCTLREAINRANALNGQYSDLTVLFDSSLSGTVTLTQGEITVQTALKIVGPGARSLAISGNSATRIFGVLDGPTVVSGLTIRDGKVTGSADQVVEGGAIDNTANLTLNDCTLTSNQVIGGGGGVNGTTANPGAAGQGGAIDNYGSLTLNNCTLTNNSATGGNGANALLRGATGGAGGPGQGGAIYSSTGAVSLTNCTFYNNTAIGGHGGSNGATGGNGGKGNGGAICFLSNSGTTPANLLACSISGNTGVAGSGGTGTSSNGSAGSGSGGLANQGTSRPVTVTSTIIAGNTHSGSAGADVDGAITSGGYNLIGTTTHSSGFTDPTDLHGTDSSPLVSGVIAPPSNTGGSTDTFTLASTSPAINAGSLTVAPHRDQRGYLRTDRAEIGSFEFNPSFVNLISIFTNLHDLSVKVEVVKGRIYQFQRKPNIGDSWSSLGNFLATDLTATETDYSATAAANHAFYRVIFVQ